MQRAAILSRTLARTALRGAPARTLVPPRVIAPPPRLLPPVRHASHAAPAAQRADAPLDASLDRLLPESLFAAPAPAASSSTAGEAPRPLPRALARAAVARVLAQLRAASDAPTLEQARREESECNAMVRADLIMASYDLASLHLLATSLLRHSRDPRRQPIAFRLFAIAHGSDPMQTPDPTHASGADAPELAASGSTAPGYSWASMILSGAAPPPLGFHLLRDDAARTDARRAQAAAATRIYAALAMQQDGMGMLGMGRLLLQRLPHIDDGAGRAKLRDRAVALWRAAAKKGVADAWFELGVLHLDGKLLPKSEEQAFELFELGAAGGNARAHHALGVLLSTRAAATEPPQTDESRSGTLARSLHHFVEGARRGDAQSAHMAGLRFLLREELLTQVAGEMASAEMLEVQQEARRRHEKEWGVPPDDAQARLYFERASELGSLPASLNLAGLLVEARGSAAPASEDDAYSARLAELRRAEQLYTRVAGLAGVGAGNAGAGGASEASAGEQQMAQMADFARKAVENVQAMAREVVQLRDEGQRGQ